MEATIFYMTYEGYSDERQHNGHRVQFNEDSKTMRDYYDWITKMLEDAKKEYNLNSCIITSHSVTGKLKPVVEPKQLKKQ